MKSGGRRREKGERRKEKGETKIVVLFSSSEQINTWKRLLELQWKSRYAIMEIAKVSKGKCKCKCVSVSVS